ncbi:MAG: TIGR00282 family metallophosphoesterase [Anaerovibrio sp.]|uniref:TIGR00282 family metallophosphoesterase n=1 Tax=Anaerovibrio sp. TaxID=1872532 RepID=UPI0025C0B885|nr:TIGR00282 family metallophosphoesterase [Anaerovibrio sp.]MBE6098446.1 TIGR00282 family metallophosphoesterase [Anaerovibrio sp.]MBQ3853153.1 TIGR00282 family metallophosphoesterase [Anaerovibrio sp.]
MRILIVGDVVGRPGRKAFGKYTKELRQKHNIDIVIVNGENSAGGKGVSRKSLDELYAAGADIVTSGNHIWDNREVQGLIDDEPYLVRPANYPEGAPGKGWCLYPFKAKNIAVINLSGRAFMPDMDCPFQKIDDILSEIGDQADIKILDFHAETTSEKMAMGFYLDGRVQVVVGTHTHIQTADERLLPNSTAYITDLGMVGPWNSVLGVKSDIIIKKFTSCMPVRFDLADGPAVYSAVIVEIDDATNKAVAVERLLIKEE